jgi:hypothetical protein
MQFDNFYLVGGYRFPAELASKAQEELKFKYVGKVLADETVDEFVLDGRSLLTLPSDNAAFVSVKEILRATGYLGSG